MLVAWLEYALCACFPLHCPGGLAICLALVGTRCQFPGGECLRSLVHCAFERRPFRWLRVLACNASIVILCGQWSCLHFSSFDCKSAVRWGFLRAPRFRRPAGCLGGWVWAGLAGLLAVGWLVGLGGRSVGWAWVRSVGCWRCCWLAACRCTPLALSEGAAPLDPQRASCAVVRCHVNLLYSTRHVVHRTSVDCAVAASQKK